MPKPGPKSKAIAKPHHNPYSYQLLGPFLSSSEDFLHTAKGQDSDDEAIDNDIANDNIRCRFWTREQNLGAIKYATLTYVPGKTGLDELIVSNAAAVNIRCMPKMLRTWIQTYDEINASLKSC
jgi:hypothetical protein